jgi:predicted branched-subunit amino acid permease
MAILVPIWRGRSDLLPWTVAGAVALALFGLGVGAPWPVLAGALAGSAAGAARDRRKNLAG